MSLQYYYNDIDLLSQLYDTPNSYSMIGINIKAAGDTYTIRKEISVERENADIYLCENTEGRKFIIKYFRNIIPRANIGYGIYNHFGRGRDGSRSVFDEIRQESALREFIVKHYERVRYEGSWLIVMEFIEGVDLRDFMVRNYSTSLNKVLAAIRALAETMATWHNHGFAHGDPHLENAILQTLDDQSYAVKLIDYSQLHFKEFEYCKYYKCFSTDPLRRIREDLENPFHGKLGRGFRCDIQAVQQELGADSTMIACFDETYRRSIQFHL